MGPASFRLRDLLPLRTELGAWAFTFIAFLLSAKLGQFIYNDLGSAPGFIWPPYGIALAAVFLFGYRVWTAIALAAFVATVSSGSDISAILVSTIGNTAQALIGGYFFKRLDFRPDLSRLRDTLLLIFGTLLITTIVPTVSFILRYLGGTLPTDPAATWRLLWGGGILSVLVLTPLITGYVRDLRFRTERWLEHLLAQSLLIAITYAIFFAQLGQFAGIPLVYFLFLPFFWIALRFPPRSTSLALFICSALALTGGILFPPESISFGQWIFQTQLFLEVFAILFLILATVIEERRTVAKHLSDHVEQLEYAIKRISEQDTAKSDFLAVLAHELRNPLAPVLSTLELLRLRRAETEEATLISGAEQRLHMMGRLLDDLLDISRVSEKRLNLKKEHVQLRDIALRSVDGAKPHIEKHGHSLSVTLPAENMMLFADPIRIEQVLVNVLNNAAKYTPEGGRISLSAERDGGYVEIRIADNGTGIEPGMLTRVFEPFLQVSATKYGTSGVGVGLALAKELVEMHDGVIRAESNGLGAGSTFVIRFPVSSSTNPATLRSERSDPQFLPEAALTILIIDDNQAGAEALGRLLSFRGHRTLYSFNGTDGIALAEREHPDVILLDIGLPDIDGYRVAEHLRKHKNSAFIIALTGYGQAEDRIKALEAGCDSHLVKPVGLRDIETILASRNEA